MTLSIIQVDMLRIASPNPDGGASSTDSAFLKSIIPSFFQMDIGPGKADGRRILSECTHAPLRIDFIQAPNWTAQQDAMKRYLHGLKRGEKLVLILSVGLWEESDLPPDQYMDMLDELSKSDYALRTFFVGAPSSKVINSTRRRGLEQRNKELSKWIGRQGSKMSWVDLDALVRADGAPLGTRGSKHFGCWLEWEGEAKFPTRASGNPAGSVQFTAKATKLHDDIEAQCADEMDRNIMQIILNALIDNAALNSWTFD